MSCSHNISFAGFKSIVQALQPASLIEPWPGINPSRRLVSYLGIVLIVLLVVIKVRRRAEPFTWR